MTRASGPDTYCDFNAGGPVTDEVLARFVEVERQCGGNPSSVHAAGRRSRAVLEDARGRIAAALGLEAVDVVFTSGGTESANLAVLGLGDATLPVLLAEVEHPAVTEPAQQRGVVWWRVTADGQALVAAPATAVGLVCLAHAQGELGTLQPVAEAATLSDRLGVPMFVDAAQTLGRVPIDDVVRSGACLALSPHKCGGLRGHGVLAGRELLGRLRPLLRGGAQELGLRPGTQSPSLAAANALAIERAVLEQPQRGANMRACRDAFLDGLRGVGASHAVLTPLARSLPNTAMIQFPELEGRNLLLALDLAGIHASHGSACSSGAPTPPRILRAIGLDDAAARACVRFSFGWREDPESARALGARVGVVVLARQKKL